MTQPPPGQTPRERMRDAVSAVVQQVADQKRDERAEVVAAKEKARRRGRTRIYQLVVVAIVFVVSLVFSVPRWQRPFAAPTGAAAEHDARRAIVFAAQLVNARIAVTGVPPQNFSDIGMDVPGLEYQRVDTAYVLGMTVGATRLTYHRGDDQERFLAGR